MSDLYKVILVHYSKPGQLVMFQLFENDSSWDSLAAETEVTESGPRFEWAEWRSNKAFIMVSHLIYLLLQKVR
jgi:hypothetical protein